VLLDVEKIYEKPVHWEGIFEFPRVVEENAQVERLAPIHASLDAEHSNGLYRIHGHLSTTVDYLCSRCLEPFAMPLSVQFEESFRDPRERRESTNAEADEDVHDLTDDEILIDPYVEAAINLALAYRPLCSEDCRGLCVECGCNLNERQCQCDTRRVDPRLAVLGDLLSEDDSE
jgi:uncharacterized protein